MNESKKNVKEKYYQKNKEIEKKRCFNKIMIFLDSIMIYITLIPPLFCLGSILFLFYYGNIEGMDMVIDFIIAGLSGALLIYSLIIKSMKDELKHVFQLSLILLPYTIGFEILLIVAAMQKDGEIARVISLVTLIISSVVELRDYYKYQKGDIEERRNKNKLDETKLQEKSAMN